MDIDASTSPISSPIHQDAAEAGSFEVIVYDRRTFPTQAATNPKTLTSDLGSSRKSSAKNRLQFLPPIPAIASEAYRVLETKRASCSPRLRIMFMDTDFNGPTLILSEPQYRWIHRMRLYRENPTGADHGPKVEKGPPCPRRHHCYWLVSESRPSASSAQVMPIV